MSIGYAVGILAAHHAHDLIGQIHRSLLYHLAVTNDIDGGRRSDQCDPVQLLLSQLPVLDLDYILLAQLLALHIHHHGHSSSSGAGYAQDLEDVQRLTTGNMIDDRSIIDGLDPQPSGLFLIFIDFFVIFICHRGKISQPDHPLGASSIEPFSPEPHKRTAGNSEHESCRRQKVRSHPPWEGDA